MKFKYDNKRHAGDDAIGRKVITGSFVMCDSLLMMISLISISIIVTREWFNIRFHEKYQIDLLNCKF